MIINIRESVFETNSSSCHAIVVKKDSRIAKRFPPYINHDGKLYIGSYKLQFGRAPFEVLCGVYDKARYAYAVSQYYPDVIEEVLKEEYPEVKEISFNSSYSDDKEPDLGYIDHQSTDLLMSFIRDHNITLKDFLKDDRYVILIDGDEYDTIHDLMNTGLFNTDNIAEIVNAFGSKETF